ncbi:hypothetical protein QG083_07760 [Kingella kingae]|uniref:hypothetical protein n=1 Tax=Kingella kingae TaxID=504 RepID=UPI0025500822|nr:hypothetical protein [Kingella kingae]MDK4613085.1 hypothetical protein [Kingella kingae]
MNTRLFLSALCLTSAPLLYAQSASAPSLSVSQIIQNEIDQTWQSSDFVPTEIEPISASSTESAPTTRPVLQPPYTLHAQSAGCYGSNLAEQAHAPSNFVARNQPRTSGFGSSTCAFVCRAKTK